MKRAKMLIEKVADPDNLRLAFWKARKGKSYSREVEAYRKYLDKHLVLLREQILSGKVEVGDYRYFKVFEPKERQICASAFSEQVLHHALMNVCHKYFERFQIFDSYASRKDKGTHTALARASQYSGRYSWFLKLDVRKFFESVHHGVLKGQLRRMFKDERLLGIFDQIIDSYEAHPGRGLPIGNLTSQYFANHFLAGLDHYIQGVLGLGAYVRYMDDMVLWHDDKEVLKKARNAIGEYVYVRLKSELKPELLNHVSRGLPFLGYKIFPGKIQLTQRSKQRFIKKMKFIDNQYHTGAWSESTCQRRVLPLVAFISHADTKNFRKSVLLKLLGQSS